VITLNDLTPINLCAFPGHDMDFQNKHFAVLFVYNDLGRDVGFGYIV